LDARLVAAFVHAHAVGVGQAELVSRSGTDDVPMIAFWPHQVRTLEFVMMDNARRVAIKRAYDNGFTDGVLSMSNLRN